MAETFTVNYNWTKPEVGASVDNWGGYINADLDGIDSTVKGVSNVANAAYPASNPAGYVTAAAIPAPYVLPTASTTVLGGVKVDGSTVTAAGDGTLTAHGIPEAPTDGKLYSRQSSAWTPTIVPLGDNRIINGNFAVNQRGYVSGTALPASPTVANGYGHDRWKAGAGGCTYTFTALLPDTTITITANTLTQIIEAGMIEGGVYTLSWTGTAQARVYQGTPSGSYAASPITTASLPAGVNTIVEFNTGTVTRVKLEIGSVVTPYNRQSLAKSLADCQRYYQALNNQLYAYSTTGSLILASWTMSVQMRAAPTVTFSNLTGVTNLTGLGTNNTTAATYNAFGTITATGSGIINFNTALSAEL